MLKQSTFAILAAAAAALAQAPEEFLRERAEALQRMTRSANPTAEGMLTIAATDASPLIRQVALAGLAGRPGALQADTQAAIRKALGDPHPLVVLAAVEALDIHVDANAAAALAALACRPPAVLAEHALPDSVTGQVRTRPQEIAELAFRALGRTPWRSSAAIVQDLLACRIASARSQAAAAAAALAGAYLADKDRTALRASLDSLLADPSRDARVAAAAALAKLGDPNASGILLDYLKRLRESSAAIPLDDSKADAPTAGGAVAKVAVEGLEALTGSDWGSKDMRSWGHGASNAAKLAQRLTQIEAALKAKGYATAAPDIVPRKLTDADRALLQRLLAMGLFDPNGGAGLERVSVVYDARTVWGKLAPRMERAWRAAKGGAITSAWGAAITRTKQIDPLDLAQEIAETVRLVDERAEEWSSRSALTLAAWAARTHREADAARILFALRARCYDDEDMLDSLRRNEAAPLWLDAVHAYVAGLDEEALAAAERLVRVAGEYADAYGQGAALLAELKRRKAAGTLGKAPATMPADLAGKSPQQRVTALIASLEDVSVYQQTQPGGVDLASAPAVEALIAIGDPAVPALIECIRGDQRLTRSVHFQRDFLPHRTILAVREAALAAVQSILRRTFYSAGSLGDDFTRQPPAKARAVVAEIDKYWQSFGRLPLGKRMMLVLAEPRAAGADLRDAAMNLATLQYPCVRGTMPGATRLRIGKRLPSPAVEDFADPTAAEAILKAMDRDLAQIADRLGGKPDELARHRDAAEDQYVTSLMHLGDKRILGELLRRYRAADSTRLRRKLAGTAHWLGDSSAISEFAGQFAAGKTALDDRNAAGELRECVRYLAAARLPACEKALEALADPNHAQHKLAREQVRSANLADPRDAQWFAHPLCLRLLEADLADTTADGVTYTLQEDALVVGTAQGAVRLAVPDILMDAKTPRKQAAGRRCDVAAEKVGQLVLGMPEYHPLLADANRRITIMRRMLELYRGRLAPIGRVLRADLELDEPHPLFVAVLPALTEAATPQDVLTGRAVFQQDGKGKAAKGWSLPATGAWKARRDPMGAMPRVLIVQAETTAEGKTHCGIFARHEITVVDAGDLLGVKGIGE